MVVDFTSEKTKKLCMNDQYAKKKLPNRTVDNLFKCIQFLESASSLHDVKQFPRYRNLKPLKNDGRYSLAFEGKKSSYRLIFYILKNDGKRLLDRKGIEEFKVFKETVRIEIDEVSKHYE